MDKRLEEIRERDKVYSHWVTTLVNAPPPEMSNEEQAMLDRHELLDLVDTQGKQIAEGREITRELYSLNYTHGVDMKRANAWLKATKKKKSSVPPFVDC